MIFGLEHIGAKVTSSAVLDGQTVQVAIDWSSATNLWYAPFAAFVPLFSLMLLSGMYESAAMKFVDPPMVMLRYVGSLMSTVTQILSMYTLEVLELV